MSSTTPLGNDRYEPMIYVETLTDVQLRALRDAFPLPMSDAEHPRYEFYRQIHAECQRRKLS